MEAILVKCIFAIGALNVSFVENGVKIISKCGVLQRICVVTMRLYDSCLLFVEIVCLDLLQEVWKTIQRRLSYDEMR